MPKARDYIFVLWGDQFEEITAVIFITKLREAGLRVKVVGLTSRKICGAHGLALVPDLTLDQALSLAARTICLIVPYPSHSLKHLTNDPRLCEFFDQAQANGAKFVIGSLNGTNITDLELLPNPDRIIVYPDDEALVEFAGKLVGLLSTEGS